MALTLYFCCKISERSRVISTLEGHSLRQPLQAKQLSKTSANSFDFKILFIVENCISQFDELPFSNCGTQFATVKASLSHPLVRISRSTLARARVALVSSPLTLKAGQSVPPIKFDLRQSPAPLHCSMLHIKA